MTYPDVDPQPRLPELEERVLGFWDRDRTFEASVEQRPAGEHGANEYVFYDGPPFANGLPHYGHLLTGYVKDAVPRYQTMRGRRVERRFGWDCHGLPAEVEAERQLGLSGHREIEDYGIARFNEACRTSVLRYTKEWERYVTRQARWVDFEHDYKTLDLPYMESVMWAFKTLWDKGLVYEGYRVLPVLLAVRDARCRTPSCAWTTPTSTARTRRSPWPSSSSRDRRRAPTRLLVWTTTPWTLPSNLALAVGDDIDYAVFEEDGVRFVLAESRVEAYEPQLAAAERVGTVQRPRAGRSPLHAALPVLRRRRQRLRRARRRLRHHRGRHRHRPHRPRLRRGRPAAGRGRGHPGGRPGRLDGRASPPRSRRTRACRCSTPTPR